VKVRTKSALFTGFLLLFFLLLGDLGRRSYKTGLARLEAYQEELGQDPLLIPKIQKQFGLQLLAWKDLLLRGRNTVDREAAWQRFEEEEARVRALTSTLAKSEHLNPATREAISSFGRAHEQMGQACKTAFESKAIRLSRTRKQADQEVLAASKSAEGLLDQVQTGLTEADRHSLEEFRAGLAAEEWWILGAMILAALLLGGLGIYLHDRWITRPVLEAQEMARKIATGRWTRGNIEIPGNDNLSQLLRELNNLHLALEKRTEELTEARDGARALSQAKSDFLSRISQEMRTPLVGILGTTELLMSTDLEPDQKDFVETLTLSSRHLVTMIEDILDFAQVDSGAFEIAEDEFDVRALFEDAVEPMLEQAQGKDLQIGCMIEKKVPGRLIGDPRRIRHVATKLISNAIKFTQRGGVTISISMLEDLGKSCQLRIDVRDTGEGMDEVTSKRIFDAITDKDVSLMRKDGGLGIGLSLAKKIVDRMGGNLGFETVQGQGSHFWFRLRLGKVEPKSVELSEMSTDQIEGRRVLCMVDNEVGKTIFGRLLESLKLEVDWAENAIQARFHLVTAVQEKRAYALILLDSQLPSQDLEFVAELRRDKALGQQRILLLTQPLVTEDRRRAQEIGIDRILIKPSRESTLRDTIQEEILSSKLGCGGKVKEEIQPFDAEILLVDDNTVNQRVGKRLLEKLGCKVDLAENGRVGFEMSATKNYDIIFMDCHMPEMDGFQATGAIRNREGSAGDHQCIIAMTADGIQGVRESCLATGMDDYVVKPIGKDQLHALLQKWLGDESPVEETEMAGAGTP